MKNCDFYEVIEENNTLDYAAFCLKIKWNVSAIAGYENADGYIVQRIHYTDTVEAACLVDDYYEAWLVCGGVCDGSSKYDDAFRLDAGLSARPICRSIGKKGQICYDAKVYWVEKGHYLYDVVNSWGKSASMMAGNLKSVMAGNLKSVYVKDCPVFENMEPRFERKFEHLFDCQTDEAVERTLRHAYGVRIKQNDPNLKEHLQSILCGTDYVHLIDKICPPEKN